MKTLTIKELEEQLEQIMDSYDNGDDSHYKIVWTDDKGTEKAVMLTPYNGPFESVVQQFPDSDDFFVELPPRLLSKQGWDENTQLEMKEENGTIILKEKE